MEGGGGGVMGREASAGVHRLNVYSGGRQGEREWCSGERTGGGGGYPHSGQAGLRASEGW